jgi:DNA-binding transcriptional MerR regulator
MLSAAQKSREAFRTISEVAAELDVPQHVLRFWETKFAPVKPLKRGGGRRYYRPDDVDLLRGIRSLLYADGLTIKGVQKILREQGPRYVMELGRTATGLLSAVRAAAPAADAERRASNIHKFPRDEGRTPPPQRERFEHLLDELLDLKSKIRSARSRL